MDILPIWENSVPGVGGRPDNIPDRGLSFGYSYVFNSIQQQIICAL